VQNILHNAVN